MLLIFSVLNYF